MYLKNTFVFLVVLFTLSACKKDEQVIKDLNEAEAYRISAATITQPQRVFYGAGERQHFDFYTAVGSTSPRPFVLLIHGGAWVFGPTAQDYESYFYPINHQTFPMKNFLKNLINNGYAVGIMKYRCPKYIPLSNAISNQPYETSALAAIMSDINAAIGTVINRADSLGVNASKIGIIGESAGANLSLMYAYGGLSNVSKVKTVVSFYAPTDMSKWEIYQKTASPKNISYFGDPNSKADEENDNNYYIYLARAFDSLTGVFLPNQQDARRQTNSPVGALINSNRNTIPMTFALHGSIDTLVSPKHLDYLKTSLGAVSYDVTRAKDPTYRHLAAKITGFGHGWASLGNQVYNFDTKISPKVVTWLNARLKSNY